MLVLLNGSQAGNQSGTGIYAAELAQWLPTVGAPSGVDVATIWPEGIPHARLDFPAHEAFVYRRIRGPLGRIWYDQIGINGDVKRLRADLVHYPASVGNLFGVSNMVVTVHDLSFLHDPGWFHHGRAVYFRFAVSRSVHIATRIIAVSQHTADDLVRCLGVPRERIDVIPNGVDASFRPMEERCEHEDVKAIRKRLNLPQRFVLYVGTLEPRKNLVRLIEAWSSIAGECPHDLVLAGRDGWKVEPIRAAAAASPYAERIHFAGHVARESLPALYNAADAFAYPSLFEGFGIPPLEAMACGTPVLTSNVSSLPEVVDDAAVLVEPTDVDAIAEGLRRLLTDEELRDSLRNKGLARAAHFSWKQTAERTVSAYRLALGL